MVGIQRLSKSGIVGEQNECRWSSGLIQQGQISDATSRADSLEQRVSKLEAEIRQTNDTLMRLLRALETRFGEDLDRDGRIG